MKVKTNQCHSFKSAWHCTASIYNKRNDTATVYCWPSSHSGGRRGIDYHEGREELKQTKFNPQPWRQTVSTALQQNAWWPYIPSAFTHLLLCPPHTTIILCLYTPVCRCVSLIVSLACAPPTRLSNKIEFMHCHSHSRELSNTKKASSSKRENLNHVP